MQHKKPTILKYLTLIEIDTSHTLASQSTVTVKIQIKESRDLLRLGPNGP